MKWFEDIFTKSKLLIICGALSMASYFALACISVITSAHLTVQYLILAALSALLIVCYKKGETSCQKALIGAVLGVLMYAYWGVSWQDSLERRKIQ